MNKKRESNEYKNFRYWNFKLLKNGVIFFLSPHMEATIARKVQSLNASSKTPSLGIASKMWSSLQAHKMVMIYKQLMRWEMLQ